MANATLEERVATLEAELAELKKRNVPESPQESIPWYKARFGAFKDDPDYEEAMRLGRKWREAQQPDYMDEDEETA